MAEQACGFGFAHARAAAYGHNRPSGLPGGFGRHGNQQGINGIRLVNVLLTDFYPVARHIALGNAAGYCRRLPLRQRRGRSADCIFIHSRPYPFGVNRGKPNRDTV